MHRRSPGPPGSAVGSCCRASPTCAATVAPGRCSRRWRRGACRWPRLRSRCSLPSRHRRRRPRSRAPRAPIRRSPRTSWPSSRPAGCSRGCAPMARRPRTPIRRSGSGSSPTSCCRGGTVRGCTTRRSARRSRFWGRCPPNRRPWGGAGDARWCCRVRPRGPTSRPSRPWWRRGARCATTAVRPCRWRRCPNCCGAARACGRRRPTTVAGATRRRRAHRPAAGDAMPWRSSSRSAGAAGSPGGSTTTTRSPTPCRRWARIVRSSPTCSPRRVPHRGVPHRGVPRRGVRAAGRCC